MSFYNQKLKFFSVLTTFQWTFFYSCLILLETILVSYLLFQITSSGYLMKAEAKTSVLNGSVNGSQVGGVSRDSCNRVNFSYIENPACQDLLFDFNSTKACQVINKNKRNHVSSYSWSVTMRSNDKKTHTVTYSGGTNFCNYGYKQMNQNGFCSCGDRSVPTQGTINIPATGAVSITFSYPNPFGGVCGTWQMDYSVSAVDGNSKCNFGDQISSGTCETGTTCTGNNPPPPTATPTPPPLYSISGNVYLDADKNRQYTSPPDVLYSDKQSNFDISGPTSFSFNSQSGAYATETKLPQGTYTISYISLPQGYYLTTPLNGPPPSYRVTVGNNCRINGVRGAACSNGNITNLNFGISNFYPWFQSNCGDIRNDNGITDNLPKGQYGVITSSRCNTPGAIFTGNINASFGNGHASTKNHIIGGTTYPEIYPSRYSPLSTSYPSLLSKATNAGITPTDITSTSLSCTLNSCTLPSSLTHGLYIAKHALTLNAWTAPANQNYIFLVNGDLIINGPITVPVGSSVLFSAKGTITVSSNVGAATSTTTTPTIAGWYVAGGSFILPSSGNCTDKRLNIAGSVIVNALGTGGTFQNNRDLCAADTVNPTVSFSQRLDMILNAPQFLQQRLTLSKEISP